MSLLNNIVGVVALGFFGLMLFILIKGMLVFDKYFKEQQGKVEKLGKYMRAEEQRRKDAGLPV